MNTYLNLNVVIVIKVILILFLSIPSKLYAQSDPNIRQSWLSEAISAPVGLKPLTDKPIIIAIVDDGVRITHQDLKDFIWVNPNEIANNGLDDDGNGYVDDVYGWDVSNDHNQIIPPEDRPDFYHGTHLAGIIVQIAKQAYGNSAANIIKIMPIKSLDNSGSAQYFKQAYKGIEYAVNSGADIILAAWNKETISRAESEIIQKAIDNGIMIVSSAGNFPEDKEQFPAAQQGVLAIASIDIEKQKAATSNYGAFVDLLAPGESIESAGVSSDTAYKTLSGTSGAAAIVVASAAIVKLQNPTFTVNEVKACLINSALPLKTSVPYEIGKLGSGALNLSGAIDCELIRVGSEGDTQLSRTKDYLHPNTQNRLAVTWTIKPKADIKGIRFSLLHNRTVDHKGIIEFRVNESSNARVIGRYAIADLPKTVYIPGKAAYVKYQPSNKKDTDWLFTYESDVIDSRTRYCSGTTQVSVEGNISDGSGEKKYSYNTSCKWLITAPQGKVIKFSFTALDTEVNIDRILFFDGMGTNGQIMASFSGKNQPPELTSWSNEVLVWFLSDSKNQYQGWNVDYHFVAIK